MLGQPHKSLLIDEKPFTWRYRDCVIRAFNEDKPYDRFIVEQLAGDELDDITHDSIIATGFYRLGVLADKPDDNQQARDFGGCSKILDGSLTDSLYCLRDEHSMIRETCRT